MAVAAAASPNIYLQDLVSIGRGLINRGLVLAHDSSLPVDTFEILLIDGSLVYKNAGEIRVVDRSHLHLGQVVGSASDVAGQLGVITGVATKLDLAVIDSHGVATKVIRGVSPSKLRRVRSLNLGDFVVHGSWLGQVVEVSIDVDVLFEDGAVCRVTNAESKMLQVCYEPYETVGRYTNYRQQMNSVFYPGQRVAGQNPATFFKAARWLNGYWNPDRLSGNIVKVETSGVLVYWIGSTHHGTNQWLVEESAPPAYQNPTDQTFFCPASDCSWGVADRCFFREPTSANNGVAAGANDQHEEKEKEKEKEEKDEEDNYGTCSDNDDCEAPITTHVVPSPTMQQHGVRFYRKQLTKVFFEGHRRGRRPHVGRHVELGFPMVVANSRTTVDVLWQDGTRQHAIRSSTVIPFGNVNEQEFFPGQHVNHNTLSIGTIVDATGDHDATTVNDGIVANGTRSTKRVGVVRSLHCKDQTVSVSWFKATVNPNETTEVESNETASAYDLKRDPDHSAFYGDIVIHLLPPGSASAGGSPPFQGNHNKKNNMSSTDLSWVGHVVDLPHGHIQVKWGDGSMSTVSPHEIVVVNEEYYMDLWTEMGDWVEEGGINDEPEEPAAGNMDNDLLNPADNSDVEPEDLAMTRTGHLGSVVRSLLRLTGNVFDRGMGYVTNWRPSSSLPSIEFHAPTNVSDGNVDTAGSTGAAAEASTSGAVTTSNAGVNNHDFALCFPRFDVMEISPPDHHYLGTADQGDIPGKSWGKTVQKEWKILENNLPETIYVRVFEDRMDLLRVVIVGPSGTPYEDGLFFFDLQLPPSYPAMPPLVCYHSFGLRINPNLYESGTVCLSLLNTFGGEGTEVWSPATSTLLQVIVSIQGLVLNDQPYYNEAGYETQVGKPEGHRNALPYNENAYLLTLRTMLHLLRRPPRGFEEFIKDHFHRRGRFVLRTCKACQEGSILGTLIADSHATEMSRQRPCTAGLKLALANVVPSLMAAFLKIGVEECKEF